MALSDRQLRVSEMEMAQAVRPRRMVSQGGGLSPNGNGGKERRDRLMGGIRDGHRGLLALESDIGERTQAQSDG